MTDQEWKQYLDELRSCGFTDTVETFEQADKEVQQEMRFLKGHAAELIELANIIQHVDEADKEGRYIWYLNPKGDLIVH